MRLMRRTHVSCRRIPLARYKYLRQGITLTGFGSPIFEDAVKAAQEIYEIFQRQFSEGEVETWNNTVHAEHPGLDMSNRYFTPKRDARNMPHIPFSEAVDPRGILEDMTGTTYVHGEDNEVQYYKYQTNADSNGRYSDIKSKRNRIGTYVKLKLRHSKTTHIPHRRYSRGPVIVRRGPAQGQDTQDGDGVAIHRTYRRKIQPGEEELRYIHTDIF
jgi:hypothetical protein